MRVAVRFIVGLVLLLLIAWIVVWWEAQSQMAARFDDQVGRLKQQGWTVTYGQKSRGTSPLAAVLTVKDLLVTSPPLADGHAITVTLPQVSGRIDIANPLLLHVALPNRINLSDGAQMQAVVTFGSVKSDERLNPRALFDRHVDSSQGGELVATDVDLLASGSLLVMHFDRLTGETQVNRQADSAHDLLAVHEVLDGIALSPLIAHMVSAPFNGAVTHLALALHVSGPAPKDMDALAAQWRAAGQDQTAQQRVLVPVVHAWAAAGGHAWFNTDAVVGPSTLTADGNVAFDAQQQPNGKADVTMDHLDAFSAAIVQAYPEAADTVSGIQAMLTPYLAAGPHGQTLTMHVAYGAGAVTVNGQKQATMPPVDWNALANPQPAAAAPAATP